MAIPGSFNSDGVLPPGTYDATIGDIRSSILVNGNQSPGWDKVWRNKLLDNASVLINELWQVEIDEIFLDGSFVEDKDHPNDIDGYFDTHLNLHTPADVDRFEKLVSNLNNLNPHKIWIWDSTSRRKYPGSHKFQLPMWIQYRVELYPHLGQGAGIKDKFGNDMMFPSAFRQSRNEFKQKGIVRVTK